MENPRRGKTNPASIRRNPRKRSPKRVVKGNDNTPTASRKGSVEILKAAGRMSGKLSPRSWQKTSKSAQMLRKKSDNTSSGDECYKSDKICCWELTNIVNDEKFEKYWQDTNYDLIVPLPKRLKFAHKRYLYFHDVYNSQLFEVYDTGSRVYLMRWTGPSPADKIKNDIGVVSRPFMTLWEEFVSKFEPGKFKRIFVHPEENDMREFLEELRYVELLESGNDYEYEKWYVHNPEEYSSS